MPPAATVAVLVVVAALAIGRVHGVDVVIEETFSDGCCTGASNGYNVFADGRCYPRLAGGVVYTLSGASPTVARFNNAACAGDPSTTSPLGIDSCSEASCGRHHILRDHCTATNPGDPQYQSLPLMRFYADSACAAASEHAHVFADRCEPAFFSGPVSSYSACDADTLTFTVFSDTSCGTSVFALPLPADTCTNVDDGEYLSPLCADTGLFCLPLPAPFVSPSPSPTPSPSPSASRGVHTLVAAQRYDGECTNCERSADCRPSSLDLYVAGQCYPNLGIHRRFAISGDEVTEEYHIGGACDGMVQADVAPSSGECAADATVLHTLLSWCVEQAAPDDDYPTPLVHRAAYAGAADCDDGSSHVQNAVVSGVCVSTDDEGQWQAASITTTTLVTRVYNNSACAGTPLDEDTTPVGPCQARDSGSMRLTVDDGVWCKPLPPAVLAATDVPACPPTWLQCGAGCFRADVDAPLSAADASAVCATDGAYLASVSSAQQADHLHRLSLATFPAAAAVWTGWSRASPSASFTWAQPSVDWDGAGLWSDGQPGSGGHCVAVVPATGEWVTRPCDDELPFVCSSDVVADVGARACPIPPIPSPLPSPGVGVAVNVRVFDTEADCDAGADAVAPHVCRQFSMFVDDCAWNPVDDRTALSAAYSPTRRKVTLHTHATAPGPVPRCSVGLQLSCPECQAAATLRGSGVPPECVAMRFGWGRGLHWLHMSVSFGPQYPVLQPSNCNFTGTPAMRSASPSPSPSLSPVTGVANAALRPTAAPGAITTLVVVVGVVLACSVWVAHE